MEVVAYVPPEISDDVLRRAAADATLAGSTQHGCQVHFSRDDNQAVIRVIVDDDASAPESSVTIVAEAFLAELGHQLGTTRDKMSMTLGIANI